MGPPADRDGRRRAAPDARRGGGRVRDAEERRAGDRGRGAHYLKGRLSSYKVPRRVLFVEESELSFTASQQKVQLEALRALAVERLAADGIDPEWAAYLSDKSAAARLGFGGGATGFSLSRTEIAGAGDEARLQVGGAVEHDARRC